MHLFVLTVIAVGGYFIYKYVYNGLHKLEVEEKIEDIKLTQKAHELTEENKEAKKAYGKQQKDIEKFIN